MDKVIIRDLALETIVGLFNFKGQVCTSYKTYSAMH